MNGGVIRISIKCIILIEVAIFQVDGTYIELLFLMNQKKFLPREFFFFFSGRVLTTERHVTFSLALHSLVKRRTHRFGPVCSAYGSLLQLFALTPIRDYDSVHVQLPSLIRATTLVYII